MCVSGYLLAPGQGPRTISVYLPTTPPPHNLGTSEGSVTLTVDNEDALMKPQKAGKELKIKCDLDLVNVSKI